MLNYKKRIKVTLVGGGSQSWSPTIIRDIIFKPGMERAELEFRLLDLSLERARAIEAMFRANLKAWKIGRVAIQATRDPEAALAGADFVVIAISTGRLETMRHDIAIPEKYGIYHTVGDTSGPGGWSRALRNIPVFRDYAKLIKKLAPQACILNYTNPMGALTKVLSDELGRERVVGLCHGLFENYHILKLIFGLKSEQDIQVRFGGLNHFFWIFDFKIKGRDGYALLRKKLRGRNLATLVNRTFRDAMGFGSNQLLAGELFEQFGYLPYFGDRHTSEFFCDTMTDKAIMRRFKLVRTSVVERAAGYRKAAAQIKTWTAQKSLPATPSRETAADIIHAITFGLDFTDVINSVNIGQIDNLPRGAVVETLGRVNAMGFTPFMVGPLPEPIKAVVAPHAEVQVRTVQAGLAGNMEAALLALINDPVCAHLPPSDIRKMGMELLRANRKYLPQFFK
ncbi:MAG: hypothetical protein NT011_10570 [Kiritimatiellaeota bacterium]|nr:hypothetical protein [Kiritimatiellota bacterium]